MKALLMDALRAHECRLPVRRIEALLELDLALNAQGLEIWLDKQSESGEST